MKMKGKKRVVGVICVVVVLLVTVIPFSISAVLYEMTFGRYETQEPYLRDISEFDGLEVEQVSFQSKEGNELAGYLYTHQGSQSYEGIIVLAHGLGGGGQNSYMDVAHYFTSNGFLVFAYDATGNDNSEGKSVRGIPQGVEDLEQAIAYIKTDAKLKEYPICLFGHSWGGYSVANVLSFCPEIKAVVSCSGFHRSSDLIEAQGRQMVGGVINILLPYVRLYEKIKFGAYADTTAMEGFEQSDAAVYIVHSQDDTTVLPEYGYDLYQQKYANDPRFQFCLFEESGHNFVYYSDEAREYVARFNEAFSEYFETHELTEETRVEYIHENMDKQQAFALNEELFADFLEFYRNSIVS